MSFPPTSPLYRQISDLLVRQIASGALLAGERLPPERDMARTHGVAVGTLRKALKELQDQGVVERRHGSGNYIRGVRDPGGLYGFFRLEPLHGDGLPDATLVSLETVPKLAGAPDFGKAARAHRIRRLRRLDDIPSAIEEIWLDEARAPELAQEDIAPSLYRTYLQLFGLRIVRVEDRIGVASLPEWAAGFLPEADAAGMGCVDRVSWAQDGKACEYSRTWFDPRKVRYVNRMK